ncbi:MAG: hypothetical protein IJG84_18930 [Kiritimatiellae bacterium]|nr:hypothetical protein [Kiritimatiellia bacterium]
MKIPAAVLSVAAILSCGAASADVVRVETPPAIDGRLDEPAWARAKWETGFRRFAREKNRVVKADTAFAVVTDGKSLYFGVKCFEPDMARLAVASEHGIFSKFTDTVEIDFCPNGTPFERYQFVFAQRGDTYAMFFSENGQIRPDPYGPEFDRAVGVFDGGWTLEVRIPLSAFYMTRKAMWGKTWLVNVGRARPGEGFSAWSDLEKGFMEAERYRRMGGFPPRPDAEDVWVKSAVAHVDGKGEGGLSGSLELLVFAAVPGEVKVETTFGSVNKASLAAGDASIIVPARFPENGRIPCDIRLTRKAGGAAMKRTYPVTVDYTPIAVRFSSPSYRANFYPGQNADSVSGTVKTVVPGGISLVLEGPGFPRREKTLPSGGGEFSFDTKGFAYGEATLSVSAGGETLTRKVRRLEPRATGHMTWIENGNLVFDGKPVFRRNMYAEYYRGGEAFKRRYDADDLHQTLQIKRIATIEPNRLVKGLERKEATRDVKPCAEYFAKLDEILAKGVDSPDGSYYYISDEPECRNVSPIYLKYIYEYAAEKDPYHVILCGTRGGMRFIDCADWFETHPYINPHIDASGRRVYGREFSTLGSFVEAFRPAEHPEKCIGCMPTCFSYSAGLSPTFREYVTHTWNFLVHGVRTFFPYAYHDLGDTPMLFEGVRFTNESVERLSDFFLLGRRTMLVKTAEVEGAIWELDGKRLFALVNMTTKPLGATVKGIDGRFDEFRGGRTFNCRADGTKFSFAPLEAIVATSEKMDGGLASYEDAAAKVASLDGVRLGRDNQLKPSARKGDVLVGGNSKSRKLFDGTLDVVAWSAKPGKTASLELSFVGFAPVFRELRLFGANISAAKVSIRRDGEWAEQPAETETTEFSKTFKFAEALRTVKLRIDMPRLKSGTAELYEIEMPACDAAEPAAANATACASREPAIALWRTGPLVIESTAVIKTKIPAAARWLVFELAGAERLNKAKYSAWSLSVGSKGGRWLAGDVTTPQKGLYTIPVTSDIVSANALRLWERGYRLTLPFIAAVEEPEQYLSFVEADGRWKFTLKLAAPCEDVTCSVYGSDGRRPVPYPVDDAGSSVALKPDATRRLWTAEIPVPPAKAARSGKPMHPWAKATVLGGAIDIPIMSSLRRTEKSCM